MKLINPTDEELNAAFAEKVCDWQCAPDGYGIDEHYFENVTPFKDMGPCSDYPFTQSADAVLPLLEKCNRYKIQKHEPGVVWVDVDAPEYGESVESTLPKAIVVALLRAHQVEVEFTQ